MLSRYLIALSVICLVNMLLQAQASTPIVAGDVVPSSLRTETGNANVLVTGVRIANDFDDNALDYFQNKQSNMITSIEPHIGVSLFSPRVKWTLDYHPGFSFSHQLPMYDSRSQILDTRLEFMFSNRLSLRVREDFLQTNNPSDLLREFGSVLGSGVVDRPNAPLATTARARSEQSGGDLFYALDSHTVVSVGGAFFRVSYDSPEQNRLFARTQSMSAHAVYSHHVTRRRWIGVEYSVQHLISEQLQSRALVHSMFYTDTTQIRPHMSLTFFAGPERLQNRDGLSLFSQPAPGVFVASWQWAGGITYAWTDSRTSLSASFSHRISDGGGLQGIVRASDVTAQMHRQIAGPWKADLLTSYYHNAELAGASAPGSYVSVACGVSRALTPRLSWEVRYWRFRESATDALASIYFADHNRFSTSLMYDFKTGLGR